MPITKLNKAGIFRCIARQPESGWIGQSDKGSDYIAIDCEVDEECPEKGQQATAYLYLTDAAFERSVKTLADAFGFDGNFVNLQLNKVTLDGMPCSITTEFESYEGKDRLKVKWLNNINRTPKIDPQKASEIASRLTRRAQAIMKSIKPAAKPEPVDNQDNGPF